MKNLIFSVNSTADEQGHDKTGTADVGRADAERV